MVSLFRLPGSAGSALLLGLTGGYPIGARAARQLYESGTLTREETQRLLTFCNNSNPAFFISVLGVGVFQSTRTGIWLWLIHIFCALLTGLLFRGRADYSARRRTPPVPASLPSFPAAFVVSVRDSAVSMLSICAFVVFFYVLANPFTALTNSAGAFLVGVLELFSATPLLSPNPIGFILASFCAGWGGLSVFFQTAAVLDGSDLSLKPYFLGKILQAFFSAALAALLQFYLF